MDPPANTETTPPANSSIAPPPSSLASSPPPPAATPPPPSNSSPPPSQPATPPASNTPTQSSPPPTNSVPSPHSGSTLPVFSPPAPDANGGSNPVLSDSPAPFESTSGTSGASSSDYRDLAIITGVIGSGVLILILACIYLICARKKRSRQYSMEHGLPLKDGDQYHKGPKQQNNTLPMDANAKSHMPPGVIGTPMDVNAKFHTPPGIIGAPPGVMGTPIDGNAKFPMTPVIMGTPIGGGWGVSPSPPVGNASSEFNSPAYVRTPTPSMGGFRSKVEFTYEELVAATSGFSQSNLLGEGGFGFVHKGALPNGREVAVKSLKSGSGQGEREFQAEVEIISRVHHRHLVSLVGFCIADAQRMLVYEFVPNKTLEFHLHGEDQSVMDWVVRRRIAVGSAKGLSYLHEDCHPRIIHRDIKASNILLDLKFEALVADFGLAKLTSDNYTHVSTRVMGTFGYMAPEYAASGKLTEKSDVFSFGVMLLELVTGRRPIDLTDKIMEDSLVDWARPLMSKALENGDYSELVDPRLENKYVPSEMARMIACAAACIRRSARRRPRMSQIVRGLVGDSSLDDLNEGVKPGESATYKPYDTSTYNADMIKFRKMVMSSQDFNSNEYGATSDQSQSSSRDSREMDIATPDQKSTR